MFILSQLVVTNEISTILLGIKGLDKVEQKCLSRSPHTLQSTQRGFVVYYLEGTLCISMNISFLKERRNIVPTNLECKGSYTYLYVGVRSRHENPPPTLKEWGCRAYSSFQGLLLGMPPPWCFTLYIQTYTHTKMEKEEERQ